MLPDAVASLLERQCGVAARPQLVSVCGLSRDQIDGLVHRRQLIRIHRGVYRARASHVTPEMEAMAAALRCPTGGRVTGPRVLGLLGIGEFRPPAPLLLLRPRQARLTNVPIPHRVDVEPDRDRASLGPIPATTPLRAVIESADPRLGLNDGQLLGALDGLRSTRRGATQLLRERITSWPRNAVGLRWARLLESPDATSESPKERELAALLDMLPISYERQVWLTPRRRVDFLIRFVMVVVEYDGDAYHGGEPARQRDAERDDDLEAAGAVVIHVTAEDLRQPDALCARIMSVVAARQREFAQRHPGQA